MFILTFYNPNEGDLANSALADMRPWSHKVIPIPLSLTKTRIILSHLKRLTGIPQIASLHRNAKFSNHITEIIRREKIDIVICQFPQMAQYINDIRNVRTVMDVSDAFSVSFWRRFSSESATIKKALAFAEWLSWVRYERRHYPKFDIVMCLSEQDKFGLSLFSPTVKAVTITAPIGEVQAVRRPSTPGQRIGFFGSFSHLPNVEAVVWFLEHVLPLVEARIPTVQFHIAGAGLPSNVTSRLPGNTSYHGYVDDLGAFIGDCDVVVAPLLSGGGVKIKTLQALQYGAPLVTTSIGAEGVDIEDGENALIRNGAEKFADAVAQILRNPDLATRLSESAKSKTHTNKSQLTIENSIKKAIIGE
ncbi:MAG: glycosyltransferase family 4 protein [Formivibrio sp.]|nr:glycosyltransferase family 4 protein [Formivibrio sp.]